MQQNHSEALYQKTLWVGLGEVAGIGSQTFCQLLKAFGSPANVYAASYYQLIQIVPEKIAIEIGKGFDEALFVDTFTWLSQPNNHLVTLADDCYPKALLEISDPPPFLYAKGNLALLNQPSIAVVGSRNASVQGEKKCRSFRTRPV